MNTAQVLEGAKTMEFTVSLGSTQQFCTDVSEATGMESKQVDSAEGLSQHTVGNAPAAIFIDLSLGNQKEKLQSIPLLKDNWPFSPIIVAVTAGTPAAEEFALEALMLGADDFVEVPIRATELHARVVGRRDALAKKSDGKPLTIGDLTISPVHRSISAPKGELFLSPKEISILALLAEAEGTVVTREIVKRRCWRDEKVSDNALNRKLCELRLRLKKISNRVSIRTIYGVGFFLEVKKAEK